MNRDPMAPTEVTIRELTRASLVGAEAEGEAPGAMVQMTNMTMLRCLIARGEGTPMTGGPEGETATERMAKMMALTQFVRCRDRGEAEGAMREGMNMMILMTKAQCPEGETATERMAKLMALTQFVRCRDRGEAVGAMREGINMMILMTKAQRPEGGWQFQAKRGMRMAIARVACHGRATLTTPMACTGKGGALQSAARMTTTITIRAASPGRAAAGASGGSLRNGSTTRTTTLSTTQESCTISIGASAPRRS
jgi:hypothetical protein